MAIDLVGDHVLPAAGLVVDSVPGDTEALRVALARALATHPEMLLLDEPLSALDATTRVDTRRGLRRHLQAHAGRHPQDPFDAEALADRIMGLEAGRLVPQGTLAEITSGPRSRYVVDLVGVKLLTGRAVSGRVDVGGVELVVAVVIDGESSSPSHLPPSPCPVPPGEHRPQRVAGRTRRHRPDR